jgi:hypothetical protein
MQVLGNDLVYFLLGKVEGLNFAAHRLKCFKIRVSERPKIRGIDLSVSAETPKILIDHRGIQKRE